ncbi:hypothetical protein AMJ57_01445 [Parcubacteria bacterium SG8_24]|nr:MAG: hypothetical protein AMJ57_01445 [Parcubacteria bacterium SG8_24]
MLLIQVFIVAFAVFAVSRAVVRFREGLLGLAWLVFWALVWVGVAVVVSLPQTTTWFASLVGVGRGVDAVIYVAIVFLFYLVFRIFLRLEKLEHDISLLVREFGLKTDREGPPEGGEQSDG